MTTPRQTPPRQIAPRPAKTCGASLAAAGRPGRPTRVGVSVERRRLADGTVRYHARCTDPRGRRHVVAPPTGGKTWPDWGEAFAAACAEQIRAERLSYRSHDGERLLFKDLVAYHYLPSIADAAANTRKNTASHLGDGTGISVRKGAYAARAARSQLLVAFGACPISAIGPKGGSRWISPRPSTATTTKRFGPSARCSRASCRSRSTRAGSATTSWTRAACPARSSSRTRTAC